MRPLPECSRFSAWTQRNAGNTTESGKRRTRTRFVGTMSESTRSTSRRCSKLRSSSMRSIAIVIKAIKRSGSLRSMTAIQPSWRGRNSVICTRKTHDHVVGSTDTLVTFRTKITSGFCRSLRTGRVTVVADQGQCTSTMTTSRCSFAAFFADTATRDSAISEMIPNESIKPLHTCDERNATGKRRCNSGGQRRKSAGVPT